MQKNSLFRIFRMLLLMLLLMFLLGCTVQESPQGTQPANDASPAQSASEIQSDTPSEWATKEAYKADKTAYVKFTQDLEPRYVYVSREYILEYESQFPECHGTLFRDQLMEEDRCIYNAYLYALEHCFTGFELYVQDNDRDFYYIREAVSLASPFLEQNLNQYGEDVVDWPSDYLGEPIWFTMPQFAQERWERKEEALETCRRIVAQIPEEYKTQEQKMEYLYRYVCDHVEYVMYEKMADEDYLYDAVCKGQTVCDGYSNMLNLLFCLIGVESYEAMGIQTDTPPYPAGEEAQRVGHTWVVAKIGDSFYNFDPTMEDSDGFYGEELQFFGFSDQLLAMDELIFEKMRPKCTDTSRDSRMIDVIVEDWASETRIREIVQKIDALMESGDSVVTILLREDLSNREIELFAQACIGRTQKVSRESSFRIFNLKEGVLLQIAVLP